MIKKLWNDFLIWVNGIPPGILAKQCNDEFLEEWGKGK